MPIADIWQNMMHIFEFLGEIQKLRYNLHSMKNDFIPGDSRATMLSPGTRVMIFQEGEHWLAMAVDAVNCIQAKTLDELKDYWVSTGHLYEHLKQERGDWWEPPKPTEYAVVWDAGSPIDFVDGMDARTIDTDALVKASNEYQARYDSYDFWDKKNG